MAEYYVTWYDPNEPTESARVTRVHAESLIQAKLDFNNSNPQAKVRAVSLVESKIEKDRNLLQG